MRIEKLRYFKSGVVILVGIAAVIIFLGLSFKIDRARASILSAAHYPGLGGPSAAMNHRIQFAPIMPIPASGSIKITFASGFSPQTGFDYTDVDVLVGMIGSGTHRQLAASASSTTDGVAVSGNIITISLNSTSGLSSSTYVEILIGTNAEGGDKQYINASTAGSATITVESFNAASSPLDNGSITMTIGSNAPEMTVTQSGGSTNATEGGATDSYSVVLANVPEGNVTVFPSANSQLSFYPSSRTFSIWDWYTPQSFSVTAVDDTVNEGDHSAAINHRVLMSYSEWKYHEFPMASVTVNITDNDSPGVTVAQTGGSTAATEGGATDTYTVVLTSQPSANVTITSTAGPQSSVSPASLTFTSANWNTPQTITVTAVDDFIIEGSQSENITHAATSSDANYNGILVSSVAVTITDNDTAGATISQSGGGTAVTEGGATDTYTVVLTSQPSANVTITPTAGAEISILPSSLIFTAANWNTPQTVTVTAVNDSIAEGNHNGTVTHAVSSSDTNYNGISTVSSVTASITDNDIAGFLFTESNSSTTVTEGGATDTYTVVLKTQPLANVTVTGTSSAQVSVSPITLTFSTSNWNTSQTVTVTAVDDSSVEGAHTGTISSTSSSTDANYHNVSITNISVSITDNDSAAAPASPQPSPSPSPSSGSGGGGSGSGSGGGGGSSGGGGGTSENSGATTGAAPETPQKTDDLFADFPETKIKLSQKTVDNILSILKKMKDEKIYTVPNNKKLYPNARAKRHFAAQISLTLAGANCGEMNTPPVCLKAAIQNELINKNDIPKIKIQRADYYAMLLRAEKIPLVTNKQLPKKICSDVTHKMADAQIVATMRAYKILTPFKNGSCKTTLGLSKLKALIYATNASKVTDEDIKKVQSIKTLSFE